MPKIDAAVYWPPTDKVYFFQGSDYVRYRLSGVEKAEEKVSLKQHRWKGLAFEDKIDAATTVEPLGLVYFFHKDKFVSYRISEHADEEGALELNPIKISERFPFLPPKYQSELDAVLYWPNNGRLYFFKGGYYLACEPSLGTLLQPERALPGGWVNLPFNYIDAAFVSKRGKGYFFCGEEYIVYSVPNDKVIGTSKPWKDHWPGLSAALQNIVSDVESPTLTSSTITPQPRISFWQDLDITTYKANEQANENKNRYGFANLATIQAIKIQAYAGDRYYGGTQYALIGPTAFRTGEEIINSINRVYSLTNRKIERIHVFGHSSGHSGIFGENHTKEWGLYRTNLSDESFTGGGRLIDDIPKSILANNLIFLLHGCKMALGTDNFAKDLYRYLSSGNRPLSGVKIFAHKDFAAAAQNKDWIEFSNESPNGKLSNVPNSIFVEGSRAETNLVNPINRQILKR